MGIVSNTPIKSLKVVTAATSNPIAQSEAKDHLRVTTSDEDSYITNLITAATQMAQNYTNSYFIDTTLRMDFSYFPANELRLYGGQDILYGKLKQFLKDKLFGETVNLDDANVQEI